MSPGTLLSTGAGATDARPPKGLAAVLGGAGVDDLTLAAGGGAEVLPELPQPAISTTTAIGARPTAVRHGLRLRDTALF